MPSNQDILLGRIALDLQLVSAQQVEQCVDLQDEGGNKVQLGALLVQKGFLGQAGLDRILAEQAKRLDEKAEFSALRVRDVLFGNIALQRKLVSREQLNECLRAQAVALVHGNKVRLGEILVEREWLTREQVEEVLRQQAKKSDEVELPGYEIQSKLGQGGMGAVYLARQVSMDRQVAVKVLSPQLTRDPSFVQRFLSEARNSARLNHPNIIRGIDVVSHAQHHYYIMEYVEGESLRKVLESGPLPEDKAVDITLQMASALQHAEERKMVHRDVKPDNILVNEEDVAKLCDLGLSKTIGSNAGVTAAGTVVGTPDYMSPEQARGERDLDIRADLYSLGATLYHMLTGQVPFGGGNAIEVLRKHIKEPVRDPRELVPELSAAIVEIVLRLMAKSPADRFPTAAELLKTLKAMQGERAKVKLLADVQTATKRPRIGVPGAARASPARPLRRVERSARPAPALAAAAGDEAAEDAADGEGEAAPAGSGRDGVMIGVGAAVLLAGAGVLYWGLSGGPPSANFPAANNAPAVANRPAIDPAVEEKLAAAEHELQAIAKFALENPGKLREAMARAQELSARNPDNRFGPLAEARRLELQKAWNEASDQALRTARDRARDQVVERKFTEARATIARVALDFPDSTAAAKVDGAVKEVMGEARRWWAARRDEAEGLVRDGDHEQAIEAYRALVGLGLADLDTQAQERIAEIERLMVKREEERKAQARAALEADFDREVGEIFKLLDAREVAKVTSRYFSLLGNVKFREIWPEIQAHKKRIEPFFGFWKDVAAGLEKLVGKERVFALKGGRNAKGKVTKIEEDLVSLKAGVATIGVRLRDLTPQSVVEIALLALDPQKAESHLKCAIFYAVSGEPNGARTELEAAHELGLDVTGYPRALRLD